MGLGGGGPHAHQRRLAERAEVGRRLLHLGLGAAAELAGGDPERRGAGKDNGKDDGTFHKGALVWVCGVAMLMVLYAAARGFVYSATCRSPSPSATCRSPSPSATCKLSSPIAASNWSRWPSR